MRAPRTHVACSKLLGKYDIRVRVKKKFVREIHDAFHEISRESHCSQQIENVISNVHEIDKTGYHANAEYELLNEKLIYREYIVCLKKHQLALE